MKRFLINRLYAAYKALREPGLVTGSGMSMDNSLSIQVARNFGAYIGTQYSVECIGGDGELKWVENFHNIVTNNGMDHLLYRMFHGGIYPTANSGDDLIGGTYPGKRTPRAWVASTTYKRGDIVQPTVPNGRLYIAATAGSDTGTSASSPEPTWGTTTGAAQGDNPDGTVDWYEAGTWFVGIRDERTNVGARTDTMAVKTNGWAEVTPYSNTTRPALDVDDATAALGTGRELRNDGTGGTKAVFNINGSDVVGGAFLCDLPIKGNATDGLLYGSGEFAADRTVANNDTLNVTVQVQFTST